jgi:uncharacterized RDD family membrane protein YckC
MSRAASRLAGRRVAAWGIDWLIISLYAGALVPVGLLLVEHSVRLSPMGWNAVSFVILIVPATVWLAACEARERGATPGKRLLRLRVRTLRGGRLGWRRALARNAIKIALPWELGHTGAFLLADLRTGPVLNVIGMASACVACALAAGYVAALFIGAGRAPYDWATASWVESH